MSFSHLNCTFLYIKTCTCTCIYACTCFNVQDILTSFTRVKNNKNYVYVISLSLMVVNEVSQVCKNHRPAKTGKRIISKGHSCLENKYDFTRTPLRELAYMFEN